MLKKIVEFPYLVVLAAGMILGPAFWYVIGTVIAVFGLGILLGVML